MMNVLSQLQLQFLHLQLFHLKCIYLLMIIGSDAKIGSMAQVPWRSRAEEWSQPFNFRLHWVIKVDCLKILIRPQSLLLFKHGRFFQMFSRSHYSEQYVTHRNHLMKEPDVFLSSLLIKIPRWKNLASTVNRICNLPTWVPLLTLVSRQPSMASFRLDPFKLVVP